MGAGIPLISDGKRYALGYLTFEDLLREWRPEPRDGRSSEPESETQWERSLAKYLDGRLAPHYHVVRQYGIGPRRVDIGMVRKVRLLPPSEDLIEMKMGLKSQQVVSNIIGQVTRLDPDTHAGRTYVVICGEYVEKSFLNDLRTTLKQKSNVLVFHKKSGKGARSVSRIVP